MTSNSNPAYQGVAPWIKDESQHRRDMARTINAQLIGKLNVTLDVTLPSGTASMTLVDARIGYTTAIIPAMALTSDAATTISKGIWVDTIKSGSCVLHYANVGAAADNTIRFVFIG